MLTLDFVFGKLFDGLFRGVSHYFADGRTVECLPRALSGTRESFSAGLNAFGWSTKLGCLSFPRFRTFATLSNERLYWSERSSR